MASYEDEEVKPFRLFPFHLVQPGLVMLLEWYEGSSLVEEEVSRHQVQQIPSLNPLKS